MLDKNTSNTAHRREFNFHASIMVKYQWHSACFVMNNALGDPYVLPPEVKRNFKVTTEIMHGVPMLQCSLHVNPNHLRNPFLMRLGLIMFLGTGLAWGVLPRARVYLPLLWIFIKPFPRRDSSTCNKMAVIGG